MVLAGLLSAGSPLLAQTTHTAYVIPSGTAGNQAFAGALGMDFDVANTVKVTQLGCFDDNSDGIQVPISVRLYNRDTQEVLASLDFAPGKSALNSAFTRVGSYGLKPRISNSGRINACLVVSSVLQWVPTDWTCSACFLTRSVKACMIPPDGVFEYAMVIKNPPKRV